MRKTTKFLTLVLAVIMTIGMFAMGASAKFEDVDYTTAEGDAVSLLVSLGVTKGTSETKFGTEELVNRQQMAAFIYRLMKAGKSVEGGANNTTFEDLEDATFFYMISWANQTGVIKGVSDVKFNPKGNITLQDAYVMVVRALGYENDGALSYPFGYIEKAEEIGLDEDLPSTLGYTDSLTRGQVAIILANAFYADMATYEIAYESLGYDVVYDAEGQAIGVHSKGTRPYNKYDTVASKVFGVEKVTEYIVATPSYTFGDTQEIEADEEMVTFYAGNDAPFAADADDDTINEADYLLGTVEFAELGLEGKADDYFMAGIELFIKKDGDKKTIVGANSLMTKKTVAGADVVIGEVSGTTVDKYYDGEEKDYKMMNGLITIDGVKTYIFNAPYSYAKPDDIRDINAYNAQFITLGAYNGEIEEDEAAEEVYNYVYNDDMNLAYDNDGEADDSKAFLDVFAQAYYKGFYELDVYDVDGDGLYDLINYKPYSFAIIDDEENENLADHEEEFDADQKLYTAQTIVKGEKAADEDYVIAYVNAAANYAEIKAVLKATETRVNGYSTDYAKFASGEKHYFDKAEYVLTNAEEDLNNEANFNITTKDGSYYFYEGKLVYMGDINSTVNFDEDWVVVLAHEISEAMVMDGNKATKSYYVDIYHDGEIKSVKAKKVLETSSVYDADITPAIGEDYDFTPYFNKLATAKVDSNGAYYFKLLDMAEFADKTVLDDTDDADNVYAYSADENGIYKKSGTLYTLANYGDAPCTGVYVKDYTQIIIKTVDKDGEEIFEVYGAKNLPDFADTQVFNDTTVIISNNTSSTRYENLVVFFGTTEDEIDGAKGETVDYRVVKNYTVEADPDDDSENIYTYSVFNPFTGATESLEGYESTEALATGTIAAKLDNGKLDDEETYGNAYTAGGMDIEGEIEDGETVLGYVELGEYDSASGILEIDGRDDIYKVTADTVITFSDKSDASFKTMTADLLSSTSKSYRQGEDKDKALRAFISIEEDDSTKEDGFYNIVFVMVVRD